MEIEKRNAYFCKSCRKVTITVDIDEGVTPMFIRCPHCLMGMAGSFMYHLPGCMAVEVVNGKIFPLPADFEWYKPGTIQFAMLSKEEKDHVNKGGLLMRKRTNAKPITRTVK